MKARLIIDGEGPNPYYEPPNRSQFQDDESYHDAVALYDVPHWEVKPAGLEVSGPLVWILCYFDASGIGFETQRDGSRKVVYLDKGKIQCEPVDDACRAALLKHCQHVARARKTTVNVILDEVAQGVREAKELQAKNDALKEQIRKEEEAELASNIVTLVEGVDFNIDLEGEPDVRL